MSRVRIYELAKEAGMSSKALADKLIAGGYDIKGHSSTVDEETAEKIRTTMLTDSGTTLVEKRIDGSEGGTVIRRRATIIRRRPKTEAPEPAEEAAGEPTAGSSGVEVEAGAEGTVEEETPVETGTVSPEEAPATSPEQTEEDAVEEKAEPDEVVAGGKELQETAEEKESETEGAPQPEATEGDAAEEPVVPEPKDEKAKAEKPEKKPAKKKEKKQERKGVARVVGSIVLPPPPVIFVETSYIMIICDINHKYKISADSLKV